MFLNVESCPAVESYAALFPVKETSSLIISFATLVWQSFWCLLLSPLVVNLPSVHQNCPGYIASNVQTTLSSVTADLRLVGEPCNIYGKDLKHLRFKAEYQSGMSLCIGFIYIGNY